MLDIVLSSTHVRTQKASQSWQGYWFYLHFTNKGKVSRLLAGVRPRLGTTMLSYLYVPLNPETLLGICPIHILYI